MNKASKVVAAVLISTLGISAQALVINNHNSRTISVYAVDKDYEIPKYNQNNCYIDNAYKSTTSTHCDYADNTNEINTNKDNNSNKNEPNVLKTTSTCTTETVQHVICPNLNDFAIFKLNTSIEPTGSFSLYESNDISIPKYLHLNVQGATGRINIIVKNSCEMTIHDKGFLRGIYAEFGAGC